MSVSDLPELQPNVAWYSTYSAAKKVHITAPADFWNRGRSQVYAYCGTPAWQSTAAPRVMLPEPITALPEGKEWCMVCLQFRNISV